MVDLSHQVLRTDVSGMPLEWIGYQDAVRLYHLEQVAYTCGTLLYRVHGGICARTGRQSVIEVNSIIATLGRNRELLKLRSAYIPPLNNPALFRRVLADQMEFLRAHFPRSSPLHRRLAAIG
jgi:hypothetical protein